jgi:hypothetical protein
LRKITEALLVDFSPPPFDPLTEGMDPWQQHEDDAARASELSIDRYAHRESALTKVQSRIRVATRLSGTDTTDVSGVLLSSAMPPLVDGPLTRAVRATFEAWEKASSRSEMEGRGEEEDIDEAEYGHDDVDDDGRERQRMRRRHRRARFRQRQDLQGGGSINANDDADAMLEVLVSALDDILSDELFFRTIARSVSSHFRSAADASPALDELCAVRRRRLLAVATDPMGPSLLAVRRRKE